MSNKFNLKNFSFLIYGLGATGISVINYFKKKNISNYKVWDDNVIFKKKFHSKIALNLNKTLKNVDYIVLSPGISLKKTKYKKNLIKFREKIISDIDLLYLDNKDFKSIIVTGSNGKSTTCKIIEHLLKKNKFNVVIGGNIGTPVLNVKIKKKSFFVIEASSFQLSHSQFIHPNYAILLNITNDHIDWHGSMQEYIKSKLKIFQLQKKNDFALVNSEFKNFFKKRKYQGKLTPIKFKDYKNIKIKNKYLNSSANFENMNFVYTLAKLLKITDKSFIKSMNNFVGLPHRYEVFFKKKNITFINDSKATSFQATKFALTSSRNIFWILGGIPKDKDKIEIKNIKKNIIKSYIIGKNRNFFIKQLKNEINISITKNLKTSIIQALQDIRIYKKSNNIILLSPSSASFDQYKNFEDRGRQFKKLCKYYARKYI
jgi:UDP-N-acetylmuramoylalanine--D-glutamate ligase